MHGVMLLLLLLLPLLLAPPCQDHAQAAHHAQDGQQEDPACNDQQQLEEGAERAIALARTVCAGGVGCIGGWLEGCGEVPQDGDGASIIQEMHAVGSSLRRLNTTGPGGRHLCGHHTTLEGRRLLQAPAACLVPPG
jgi:hypothetical protein